MPHFGVKPFPVLQQLVMAAVLGDTAVFKHGDRIAETAGGQSVRDIYGGFASHKIVEVFVDLIFRYRENVASRSAKLYYAVDEAVFSAKKSIMS